PPEADEQVEFVPPRTSAEQRIAEVWCDLLGIDRVGRDDNFFHLGGHSLLAARTVTRTRDLFSIALSVRALFEHPTLARFAAHVDEARGGTEEAIDAAEERGAHPLSFQQRQLLFFDELTPGGSTYNAALP